jgi:hypothetical protein
MIEYEFTLKFDLPDANGDPEGQIGALVLTGCDVALFGVGRTNRIALRFTRPAESEWLALVSAVRDVTRAIPGAVLSGVMLDLGEGSCIH